LIPDSIEESAFALPMPPSYEQCVAKPVEIRADYVITPGAMAELFAWDEEDDDF
jgi:hypothetical protein